VEAGLDEETGVDMAFAARCLLRAAKWTTLATQKDGQPFASLVTHAVAPDGAVLLLLSSLAEHTRQLMAQPKCALLAVGAPENLNWQTAPRVTVTGEAAVVSDQAARRRWLTRHPYARLYADFTDFSLWRLVPDQALYVGGFGQAARLSGATLAPDAAAVTALAIASPAIVADMNAADPDTIRLLAQSAGASGPWRLVGLDIDGVDLAQDDAVLRVAFPAPVADAAGARAALADIAAAARQPRW
jgi:putative heme iron utilization protein